MQGGVHGKVYELRLGAKTKLSDGTRRAFHSRNFQYWKHCRIREASKVLRKSAPASTQKKNSILRLAERP